MQVSQVPKRMKNCSTKADLKADFDKWRYKLWFLNQSSVRTQSRFGKLHISIGKAAFCK